MDFHDWLSKEIDPEGKAKNPLLEARHNQFLNAWGSCRLKVGSGV